MTGSKDINIFIKWLSICEKHGKQMPQDVTGLKINAYKSSLLERMLSGQEPFDIPPPISFSYPWYTLIDDGYAYPLEVTKPTGIFVKAFKTPVLLINQSIWRIVEELSEDSWKVTYTYTEDGEKKTCPNTWIVKSTGIRNDPPESGYDKFWEIKLAK